MDLRTITLLSAYAVGRTADTLSTIDFVSVLGTRYESNRFARYAMENFGNVEGNILYEIAAAGVIIGTGYLLDKIPRIFSDLKNSHALLALSAVNGIAVAIRNEIAFRTLH